MSLRASCLTSLFHSGFVVLLGFAAAAGAAEPRSVSGIYPTLAMFNDEGECGTGAVAPWADRLWVITYAPHKPTGSSDKLYEITPALEQIIRPESIGGTPANRMLHRESQQLFIGPYVIDAQRKVRVITPEKMYGRLTGNARHLTAPADKIYCATMEEGLYEIDVRTLEATELWADEQRKQGRHANLPGYHGKGLYSGQGRIVYANNGDHASEALKNPAVPSGVLASWDGKADQWTVVRRNQYTEVTGPGGISGNADPERDPLWSVGWDHRSLFVESLDAGKWSRFRLPKSSHSYDGAHGWNTEWPRIREIGEDSLLMTMHGAFWRFPKTFRAGASAGIAPRSNYLKVVGDFCRWGDRVVLGCDDTAKNEFLNKRGAKGGIAGPGQSQSNLWFVTPETLDKLGPVIGRGAVWQEEAVPAGQPSDPFLFAGYEHRTLFLTHELPQAVKFTLDVDAEGDGTWKKLRDVDVTGAAWVEFTPAERGAWVRVSVDRACTKATASFHYRNADPRGTTTSAKFASLAKPGQEATGGVLHARGAGQKTLRFVAKNATGELGGYDLDAELQLRKVDDAKGVAWTRENVAIPEKVFTVDAASVLYIDDAGRRWRLPKGGPAHAAANPLGAERVCREVCTERDLFHSQGTFYELPAENAGGFAKVRPVATHERRIQDYATFRGLLVLSGLATDAPASPHVIQSDDGRCALWAGTVDDLWELGKPRGAGGPWQDTAVKAGQPSDPYLMTGYDQKRVTLTAGAAAKIRLEVDITGAGLWVPYREFAVSPEAPVEHSFPASFSAYWVRAVADRDVTASVQLRYE